MEPLYAVTYFILSVLYCITLIFMLGTLNNLNQVGLKDEKKSIVKQFGFFLLAFCTRSTFYFVIYLFHDVNILGTHHENLHFYMMFFSSFFVVIWDVLPIGYVVYTHKEFYK